MNSLQIFKMIKRDSILNRMFCGFYSADDVLPPINGFFIVNTAKSGHYGKHWVVVFKKNDYEEFFDSCGKNGSYYGLPKKKIYNKIRVQGNLPVCGYYCLYYSLMRCRGISMCRITHNLKKYNSDIYVLKNVMKHFA